MSDNPSFVLIEKALPLTTSLKHKLGVDSVRPQIQLLLLLGVQPCMNSLPFLDLLPFIEMNYLLLSQHLKIVILLSVMKTK